MVLCRKPLSIGVPVNPTRAALGSAFDIRLPRIPYWVRWASSTMTMTLSEAFKHVQFAVRDVQCLLEFLNSGHDRAARASCKQAAQVA